jgi:hypothetical protein
VTSLPESNFRSNKFVKCSFAEFPAAKTEEELRTCAEEDESSNPGLFLSVDGKEFKDLKKYRVDSRAFDVIFPKINICNRAWTHKSGI